VLHLTRPPKEDPKANNLMNMEWILNLRKEEDEGRFKKPYVHLHSYLFSVTKDDITKAEPP
jgi:hypothetical protein